MSHSWLAAPLLLVAAGAAAAVAGGNGLAERGVETPEVSCETRIQVIPRNGPPITRELRRGAVEVGGVYFVGAKGYARGPQPDRNTVFGKTRKTPYLIPSGPPVTVTVLGRSVAHIDAEVGLAEAPYRVRADAVSLTPCPPDAQVAGRRVGRYTPFNGGFRVDGTRCLRLQVQTEGEAPTRGRIAFGRGSCG